MLPQRIDQRLRQLGQLGQVVGVNVVDGQVVGVEERGADVPAGGGHRDKASETGTIYATGSPARGEDTCKEHNFLNASQPIIDQFPHPS